MRPMFNTLIVDDERPVRAYTRHVLQQFPDLFHLLEDADGGAAAVKKINQENPDLVFLDIHMPDLSGFDVLQQIKQQPLVVFLTAYDQFAVKAFEENSVDYLMKPLDPQRLVKTIERLKTLRAQNQWQRTAEQYKQLETLINGAGNPPPALRSLTVKLGNKMLLLDLQEIVALVSTEKYTAIKTLDGKSYLDSKSLSAFEQILPDAFLRVQKGAIVQLAHIKEIHKHFNGRYHLLLKDTAQTTVLTGHTYTEVVREKLGL
jgi:two-component system LytT family response regulator